MNFRFLMSGQHGDIELSPGDLAQPFLINPSEKHPFLTLGDYFNALQEFTRPVKSPGFTHALEKHAFLKGSDISEISIRSEKHGAFYHIASVEAAGPAGNVKFGVIAALSDSARKSLSDEFHILQDLSAVAPEFLPKIFCRENIEWKGKSGSADFLMVLVEWLDNYHEWHLSRDSETGRQKIRLWDYDRGFRFLSDAECFELVRQAACILTACYDQKDFRQIYPWHHGAGDFVVRTDGDRVSVKLITARQHEPLVQFDQDAETDRLVAALHFLLNLTLRIRLDRLDGVDEPGWLDDFAARAAVAGFFDALRVSDKQGRLLIGTPDDFLELLRAFDAEELLGMYESLLAVYIEEDQDDFRLIQEKLPTHVEQLHLALQEFSL